MELHEARAQLEHVVAALGAIQSFGRTNAGAPANAPWLTGTLLMHVEDAKTSADDALIELADAEELGEDAGALEPGTMELVDPRRPA